MTGTRGQVHLKYIISSAPCREEREDGEQSAPCSFSSVEGPSTPTVPCLRKSCVLMVVMPHVSVRPYPTVTSAAPDAEVASELTLDDGSQYRAQEQLRLATERTS